MQDKRHHLHLEIPAHKPYEDNLSRIMLDFIKGNYSFWLSMDADNPPLKNPLDLIDFNCDIIGLPTPIWHYTGNKKGERPIY